jgi:hypothetical protein
MSADLLHNHPQFADLIRIVAQERSIDPALAEKDYWVMHCLYGLQQLRLMFELKGGTSLSKGYQIINRFSEDIDIRIEPPAGLDVKTGRNQNSPAHVQSRREFYGWFAQTIRINGIERVERDTAFDDRLLRSAGIRLIYKTLVPAMADLKVGVLLEVGFDDVTPNTAKDISSWLYDHASDRVAVIDNRAKAVPCYHPGYTFVEKLQTVSTKFRLQQTTQDRPIDFIRHYYDVYSLLQRIEVTSFIGTEAYKAHKAKRFRHGDNPNISQNEAFTLSDEANRRLYAKAYEDTRALYYGDHRRSMKFSKESQPGAIGCRSMLLERQAQLVIDQRMFCQACAGQPYFPLKGGGRFSLLGTQAGFIRLAPHIFAMTACIGRPSTKTSKEPLGRPFPLGRVLN